jgi:5-methylcytosine-specific restriction endonuclease McrA
VTLVGSGWVSPYAVKPPLGSPSNEGTIDHIIPVSRGGTNDVDNLRLLCRSCNSKKGARL